MQSISTNANNFLILIPPKIGIVFKQAHNTRLYTIILHDGLPNCKYFYKVIIYNYRKELYIIPPKFRFVELFTRPLRGRVNSSINWNLIQKGGVKQLLHTSFDQNAVLVIRAIRHRINAQGT